MVECQLPHRSASNIGQPNLCMGLRQLQRAEGESGALHCSEHALPATVHGASMDAMVSQSPGGKKSRPPAKCADNGDGSRLLLDLAAPPRVHGTREQATAPQCTDVTGKPRRRRVYGHSRASPTRKHSQTLRRTIPVWRQRSSAMR
jgi:hypothetical protein